MRNFSLTSRPIDTKILREQLCNDTCGAYTSFEGWVRNHHQGQSVDYLEYEAHESLCQSEADKIFTEAKEKFKVTSMSCVHRTGKLNIGEMAIWIGVTAAHRDDAFKACRYIIDEIKKRLPVWKKEFYSEGTSIWVNCTDEYTNAETPSQEHLFYQRQTILKDIGTPGQEQLKAARVLVIGAGGLGSSALLSLAGAGIGHIGICEHDQLDASNLHRQHLYSFQDIGKNKNDLSTKRLRDLNPFIQIIQHPDKINANNIETIIKDYDIICDCTDNFKTKFLINDACVLNHKPLVQASIYQFEGQIRTFIPEVSGCLRCLWPEIPKANCVGTCTEAGVIGTLPSVFGHLQAHEIIKWILNINETLQHKTLLLNLNTYATQNIIHNKSHSCPVCSPKATITKIESQNYEEQNHLTINIDSLAKTEISKFIFIDIRESYERAFSPVKCIENTHWPLSRQKKESFTFKNDKQYLLFCSKGMRSLSLAEQLHQQGLTNTYSLANGAQAIIKYFNS